MIRLDDEQYRMYAAVDTEANYLPHTLLKTTRNDVFADRFFVEHREQYDVDDGIFLVDGAAPLHQACRTHDLDFKYERHRDRTAPNIYIIR